MNNIEFLKARIRWADAHPLRLKVAELLLDKKKYKNQQAVADELGILGTSLSRIINAKTTPRDITLATLQRFSKVLKMPHYMLWQQVNDWWAEEPKKEDF